MSYSKKIIDHYENPRNVGVLEEGDDVGTGMVGAPACGDVMQLQIRVSEEGRITQVRFKAFGCGSAIASASRATELLQNLSLQEAGELKNTIIAQDLALPPVKMHCSMLAEDAIKAAIRDFLTKREKNTASETTSSTL